MMLNQHPTFMETAAWALVLLEPVIFFFLCYFDSSYDSGFLLLLLLRQCEVGERRQSS